MRLGAILLAGVALAAPASASAATTRVLRPEATITLPSHVRHLSVTVQGTRTPLAHGADPAVDTCSDQTAYMDRSGATVAEYVGCWHELENWTHRTLIVRYN